MDSREIIQPQFQFQTFFGFEWEEEEEASPGFTSSINSKKEDLSADTMKLALSVEKEWKETSRKQDALFSHALSYYQMLAERDNSLAAMYKIAKMNWIISTNSLDDGECWQYRANAIQWGRKAANKKYPKAMHLLGLILGQQWEESNKVDRGSLDESILWLDQASLTPGNKDVHRKTKAYYKLGQLYLDKKDLETNSRIKIKHYTNAINSFEMAYLTGHAKSHDLFKQLTSEKKAFEQSQVAQILNRRIILDEWDNDQSLDANLNLIISNFVARFLHPFILGQITVDNEPEGRIPMTEQLVSAFQTAGYSVDEEKIKRIALAAYFKESVRGKYVHLNSFHHFRRHSWNVEAVNIEIFYADKEFKDIIRALEVALVKDFPSEFLKEQGLEDRETLIEHVDIALANFKEERNRGIKQALNYTPPTGDASKRITKEKHLAKLKLRGRYFLENSARPLNGALSQ